MSILEQLKMQITQIFIDKNWFIEDLKIIK